MRTIAWTGSSVVITSTDGSGNLLYWWQQAGASSWNKQTVATAPTGTNGYQWPAIAWTGSSVIITAPTTSAVSSLYYWWQAAGTRPWNQQTVANAPLGDFYVWPEIAWTDSSAIITAVNHEGLYYWWQERGASNWNPQTVAANPGVTYAFPTIAWTGGSVVIAAQCSDGNLYYWWQPAGGSGWNRETVATGGGYYANPSIAWTGSSVVIAAVRGSGLAGQPPSSNGEAVGNLYYWWQAAGASTWNQQTVATGFYGTPSIAWTGRAVVITALDQSGNIYYWSQPAGASGWGPPQLVASGSYQGPSIASAGGSAVITAGGPVTSSSPDGVYYWWQAPGPWTMEQLP